jgi:hypothetical protein
MTGRHRRNQHDGSIQTTKQRFADGAGAVISGVDRCTLSVSPEDQFPEPVALTPRRPVGVVAQPLAPQFSFNQACI